MHEGCGIRRGVSHWRSHVREFWGIWVMGGCGQMGDGVMGCGVFKGAGEISTIAGGMSQ